MTKLSPFALARPLGQCSRHGGFTLVELIIGIALLAILLSVAIPSYQNVIANQSVNAAATALQSAISLARSEAIKRNRSVTLRPAIEGEWTDGWLIANPDSPDEDDAALHLERLTGKVVVEASDDGGLQFNGSGRLAGDTSRTFQIGSVSDEDQQRCVTVGLDGRPARRSGGCA